MPQFLPEHMVPAIYLPLQYIPLTLTGKIDRQKLRERMYQLDWETLESHSFDPLCSQPYNPLCSPPYSPPCICVYVPPCLSMYSIVYSIVYFTMYVLPPFACFFRTHLRIVIFPYVFIHVDVINRRPNGFFFDLFKVMIYYCIMSSFSRHIWFFYLHSAVAEEDQNSAPTILYDISIRSWGTSYRWSR